MTLVIIKLMVQQNTPVFIICYDLSIIVLPRSFFVRNKSKLCTKFRKKIYRSVSISLQLYCM